MEQSEQLMRELENRFLRVIEETDKSHLRKMQKEMHRCAANCCEDQSYSMERNQNCIENCSVGVQAAQQFVQAEFSRLQNRLNRCIMECNDRARDSSIPGGSSSRLTKEFDTCLAGCVDAQYKLLEVARTNMDRTLASGKFNNP